MQQCERLRKYNRLRRGDKRLKMPDPKELGELIDGVADRLEVLEREHTEFFDRWHDERRKREALERAIEAMRVAGGSVEFQMAFDMAKALILTHNR